VKILLDITDRETRLVGTVKAQYGFRNKVDAIRFILMEYGEAVGYETPRDSFRIGPPERLRASLEGRERYEAFERDLIRSSPVDVEENLAILNSLLREARLLGVLPSRDPLEDIGTDIEVARVVNHG
jgi:hypothetical protein